MFMFINKTLQFASLAAFVCVIAGATGYNGGCCNNLQYTVPWPDLILPLYKLAVFLSQAIKKKITA